jgi:ANTAR domain
MCRRDLGEWQDALDLAAADLREREHRALQGEPTSQELRVFAAERDKIGADRDALADARDEDARARDVAGFGRDVRGSTRDRAARERAHDRDLAAVDRFVAGADRDLAAGDRADSLDDRRRGATARRVAAEDRQRASDDRDAAATRDDVSEHEIAGLRKALLSRLQIGQAEGLLMGRYSLDPDAAFRLLVKLSQEGHMKLRDVAARLVADASEQAQADASDRGTPTTR